MSLSFFDNPIFHIINGNEIINKQISIISLKIPSFINFEIINGEIKTKMKHIIHGLRTSFKNSSTEKSLIFFAKFKTRIDDKIE